MNKLTRFLKHARVIQYSVILCITGWNLSLTPCFASKSENAMNPATLAEKNLKAAKEFLNKNQDKPEIHTLPSGLQYKVTKEGKGTSPSPTDFVTVHYRGTLLDGSIFDSSYTRNTPATFAVNAVIPGWTEVLQLMKPGSEWTVYIPPQLAYGDRGVGRLIGPNALLIFDINLISVKPTLDEDQDGLSDEIDDE